MARAKEEKGKGYKLKSKPKINMPKQFEFLTPTEQTLLYLHKEQQYIEHLKSHYIDYVDEVNGEGYFLGKHIHVICSAIDKFLNNELKAQNNPEETAEVLILSCPPQHSKSMTVTETLPSYILGFQPEKRVILVAYGDDLARRFGRKNKKKLKEFKDFLFKRMKLTRDSDTDIETSKGGTILSRGIGAGITGQPADVIIIDDPIKSRREAESETMRDYVFAEYRDSILSRLSANGKVIIIMTRWHEDDLVGKIINEDIQSYYYLNFPCEAETDDDILGRKKGDPLFPEIGKDKKWLEKKKKAYVGSEGLRSWTALYQGRPTAQEGNMFKRHYWNYYSKKTGMNYPTYFDEFIQSWDCTFKDENDSDFVCGTVWGRQGSNYYLLDMLNERMDIVDTMRAINSFNAKHPKALVKLVEDKANGPAVIRLLRNEIPGLIAVNPEGGKIARANAVLGAVESGNVYIPVPEEAPWVEAYISQHASFPNGKNDDMVDSTTQALNRLIYNRSTRPPKEEKTLIQKHKEKLYKQQKRKRRSYM
jgi:predicted phage terminase large subunit-like protein